MQIFLSIILFILALGVLVTIHELGHFIAAKTFKVYCSDFSIGFGPKIVNIKRENWETSFKVGILPLGGYVSMYGEGEEIENGKRIPRTRSLVGIARWKRIIIMSAGIIMNFILAYIIFFICASCFPQYDIGYFNAIRINNEEQYKVSKKITDVNGNPYLFNAGDYIPLLEVVYQDEKVAMKTNLLVTEEVDEKGNKIYKPTYFTYENKKEDGTIETSYYGIALDANNLNINDLDDISNLFVIYEFTEVNGKDNLYYSYLNENKEPIKFEETLFLPKFDSENKKFKGYKLSKDDVFNFDILISDSNTKENDKVKLEITSKEKEGIIDPVHVGINYRKYWAGWDSFKIAGQDFAQSTTLISEALGNLFIGKGRDQVGGPIGIFTQTTNILENNPFNFYLQTWGVISVNLALFNLLPFPGLDGWQILVTLIEGITNFFKRRVYNNKNKDKDLKKLKELENILLDYNDYNREYIEKYNLTIKEELEKNTFENENEINKEDPRYQLYLLGITKFKEYELKQIEYNLTDVETFKEWGIPNKVKNIVSYVGLILLFVLMGVVFFMDIWRLF